jgi:AcrR family transcriptional regulator
MTAAAISPDERPLTPAAQRILDAASRLFYAEGIRAVGVEAIVATAGVTKKTLYDRFGSKDELVARYLRARDQRWRNWLTTFVGEHASTPRDKLLTTFDALDGWMKQEEPRGCGFANACAEFPDPEHPARLAVLEQKRWLLAYLTKLAKEANLRRHKQLARQFAMLHEGASAARGLGVISDPAYEARAIAVRLMEASDR